MMTFNATKIQAGKYKYLGYVIQYGACGHTWVVYSDDMCRVKGGFDLLRGAKAYVKKMIEENEKHNPYELETI